MRFARSANITVVLVHLSRVRAQTPCDLRQQPARDDHRCRQELSICAEDLNDQRTRVAFEHRETVQEHVNA